MDWISETIGGGLSKALENGIAYLAILVFPFIFKKFRMWVLLKIASLMSKREFFPGVQIHQQNIQINNKLVELLVRMNADRVYIIQFHNGSKFSNNTPIWRISCTHEICQKGISYEIHNTQNLLASSVWDMIGAIYDVKDVAGSSRIIFDNCKKTGRDCKKPRGCYSYEVDKMEEGMGKHILLNRGTKKYIQSAIFDEEDNVVGVLVASYRTNKETEKEQCCILCDSASEISFLLSK